MSGYESGQDPVLTVGERIVPAHRPDRPITVTPLMWRAIKDLRPELIDAARHGETLTYGEASRAVGGVYPPLAMGRLLDALREDCRLRDEPPLSSLVVRSGDGAVGRGSVGDAVVDRDRCHRQWR